MTRTTIAYSLCVGGLLIAGISAGCGGEANEPVKPPPPETERAWVPPELSESEKVNEVYDEAQDYLERRGYVFYAENGVHYEPVDAPCGEIEWTACTYLDDGTMELDTYSWDSTVDAYDVAQDQFRELDPASTDALSTALHETLHLSLDEDNGDEGLVEAVAVDEAPGFIAYYVPHDVDAAEDLEYAYFDEVQFYLEFFTVEERAELLGQQ